MLNRRTIFLAGSGALLTAACGAPVTAPESPAPARLLGALGDDNAVGDSFIIRAAQRLGINSVDAGVQADRTDQVAARVGSVIACDTVVVMAGTNDVPHGPWTGLDNVDNFYPVILTALQGKTIIACLSPNWANGADHHIVTAINDIIRFHAARFNAHVFDIPHLMSNIDGSAANINDYVSSDVAFFSERGRHLLASSLALLIRRVTAPA